MYIFTEQLAKRSEQSRFQERLLGYRSKKTKEQNTPPRCLCLEGIRICSLLFRPAKTNTLGSLKKYEFKTE